MIHLIYIYIIINSFILGAYLTDSFNNDNYLKKFLFSVVLFLFGGILVLIDLLSPKILGGFEYITTEIRFQYRFKLTDYFDKIYLDDSYIELYDSREKKLKRIEELAQNSSRQMQRHNKQIQKNMEYKNLQSLLEEQDFKYIEHRGTTDTFVKDNIELKIPWITIIKDGTPTHIIPPYEVKRINEVINGN